jgi:hypothetical protein
MPSRKLSRTSYRDVTTTGQPVRIGDSTHGESNLDLEQYHLPLEQVHGSSLHAWGVASGLRVRFTLGSTSIVVEPGVALDAAGRQISLAAGTLTEPAYAEVGTTDPPIPPTLEPVTAAGVPLTLTEPPGIYVLTIEWRETLDTAALTNPSGAVWKLDHTPWIRVMSVAGFVDDGQRVVLAQFDMGPGVGTGVTSVEHTFRREVSMPVGAVRLRGPRRGPLEGGHAVDDTDAGEIRARGSPLTPSGITVTVPRASDQMEFMARVADSNTTFAKATFAANQIVARRTDGRETVVLDTASGNITAGTSGVDGDVIVMNAAGQNAIEQRGASGDIWFRGLLRDYAGLHSGIGHSLLRHLPALTNGAFTTLHRHVTGNATRPSVAWLFASNNTDTADLTFPTSRRVFAFIAITSMDPLHNFDRGDGFFADVRLVNGAVNPGGFFFNGDHLGPSGSSNNLRRPFFFGNASSIRFRLRSTQDADVWAIGVVFSEDT